MKIIPKSKISRFIIIVIFILIVINYIPRKRAIELNEIDMDTKYKILIITEVETTGPPWRIIGEENGIYKDPKKSELIEIIDRRGPPRSVVKNLFGACEATNKYVIYCNLYGVLDSAWDKQKYKVYCVHQWDILYPIERGAALNPLSPVGYLTLMDYLF